MSTGYKLHLISFKNLDHSGAFNTLHPGQEDPKPWQVELLRKWLEKCEKETVENEFI